MKNTVTRRQLKTEVKTALKGNWGKAILLNLVPIIFFTDCCNCSYYRNCRSHYSRWFWRLRSNC